jgi:sugar/nucleoside kinase (ribokinase family)
LPALGQDLYAERLMVTPAGCLNTVTALRRLGVDVGWMGVVGNDPFSHIIDKWVAQEDIERYWITSVDTPLQRVTVAPSYPLDRARLR